MAISNIVVPGVAINSVDMIPIRAYAKAQKGKASGSLHGSHELHFVEWYARQQVVITPCALSRCTGESKQSSAMRC